MAEQPPKNVAAEERKRHWTERISRSGYFFGALLFHLIIFLMVATWVIFPAFHPPAEDFTKTYLPPSSPPPPPPQSQSVAVPTRPVSTPTTVITAPTATPTFNVPMPDITPDTTPVDVNQKMTQKIVSKSNSISEGRLSKIAQTVAAWGRTKQDVLESNSDPRNIKATFPVYLASYADGDWYCNSRMANGKIVGGCLPNLVMKINEWSHGHITGTVVPTPLDIGGPDLLDKKPPFIFFTGHKDFKLLPQEIQNLRDYLQIGGAIWGDSALPGRGSRFDVAFRREMKLVVPDVDKDFEPVNMTDDVFMKSWYPIQKIPSGMNFYNEPFEHLDIDGKLAILYTPNDYSDMLSMYILPGDTRMAPTDNSRAYTSPLLTNHTYYWNRRIFFRNYELPSCLDCDKLGMNVVGYMLVRFDKELLLSP